MGEYGSTTRQGTSVPVPTPASGNPGGSSRPCLFSRFSAILVAMPHEHGTAAHGHRTRLTIVLAITVGVLCAEIVGAVLSGSLALLADVGHLAADATGIGLALFAIWMAERPATSRRTFG